MRIFKNIFQLVLVIAVSATDSELMATDNFTTEIFCWSRGSGQTFHVKQHRFGYSGGSPHPYTSQCYLGGSVADIVIDNHKTAVTGTVDEYDTGDCTRGFPYAVSAHLEFKTTSGEGLLTLYPNPPFAVQCRLVEDAAYLQSPGCLIACGGDEPCCP